MDEIKLWALQGERASRVQPSSAMDSELRLEEILVKNPDMLIPDLTLVGRQTATDGGRSTCWAWIATGGWFCLS